MHSVACFSSAEITETCIHLINQDHDTLNFQFIHVYNNHQIIVQICNQLEKLQIEHKLVLVNYPLLTQLSVGLLYILEHSFEKITIEICANKGYRIILETYRPDERVLNHLRTIFDASYDALNENMVIWSIIPMTILYGKIYTYIYIIEIILHKYIFSLVFTYIKYLKIDIFDEQGNISY